MKKYRFYLGTLLVGLFLGWLVFGNLSSTNTVHEHIEIADKNERWTCSMHPQILSEAPGDCPICGMDLIPAETRAEGLLADQFKLTANAMALANIQTSIVGSGKAEDNEIQLSGKIAENEATNVVQVSYFSGRIETLAIGFIGEEVFKGQLLATMYSPELYAAQQELITALSLKDTQPALYKAVRTKLKLWKLSESQINKIEMSGKIQENFPVYATVSGTVSEKLVAEGAAIKKGQPLFKIANLETVWASFDVYENQINRFKKGQEITITTNAAPNNLYKSKVAFIDPILNTSTRTVTLRAVLPNKEGMFKPGMFVEGEIKTINSKATEVIAIPSSAVLWTGKRSVVYLKATINESVFEIRKITLGNKNGSTYEVLSGLKNGDEIVTNGTFTVDAAAQLQGKKSMMNKKGGIAITGHEGHVAMNGSVNKDTKNNSVRLEVSKEFQKQLNEVFIKYIALKDAFVKEESNNIISQSEKIGAILSKVDIKLLENKEAQTFWMSLEKQLRVAVSSILKTTAIKEQRNHFKQVSASLIEALQVFGVNEKVFVAFCPMADSNKGAYWLSIEKKVINPYFGNKMLTCGEVKQVIE
ncbi:efflux RND transporter periplasmic adaptor subunit [uncultured Polaribacter sp.]|uniref:efflux RND transporter periplasmic adaptor subunit n=1 Tax=uncultured Polaribacter sp. TaxID=174711 RepID=UPI0030DB8CBB